MRLLMGEVEKLLTRRSTWVSLVFLLVGYAMALWLMGWSLAYSVDRDEHATYLMAMCLVFAGGWGWFVAAAAIGAEVTSGTLGTLLTFEPRRTRVLLAKVVAACAPPMLVMAFMAALGALLFKATDAVVPYALVAVAVVGLLALLGFTAALIGRSTLAGLGALLAWGVLTVLNHWFLRGLLKEAGWKDPPALGLEMSIAETLAFVSPDGPRDATSLGFVVLGLTALFAVGAGWLALARRDVR